MGCVKVLLKLPELHRTPYFVSRYQCFQSLFYCSSFSFWLHDSSNANAPPLAIKTKQNETHKCNCTFRNSGWLPLKLCKASTHLMSSVCMLWFSPASTAFIKSGAGCVDVWAEKRGSWQIGACRHKDLICTCVRWRTLSIVAMGCFYSNQNNKGFDYAG